MLEALDSFWKEYRSSKEAANGQFLDPVKAMSLVAGGTTVRALWIRSHPWPGKTERDPCQLAEPPEGLGECTERCPCAVFALCQGNSRSQWSSPLVTQWLCVDLSIKFEQTLRERPLFEAEVLGIVCVYLPLSARPRAVSSI